MLFSTHCISDTGCSGWSVFVSSGCIWWILWFSIRYAAAICIGSPMHRSSLNVKLFGISK